MKPRAWLFLIVAFLASPSWGAQAEVSADEAPKSKKGLQVQLVDDALELGVAHATLNVQLGHLLRAVSAEAPIRPERGEVPIHGALVLSADALAALDDLVRPLAGAGVELYFILLGRATGDPRIDALLLDPRYDPAAPNKLGAFRVLDEEGRSFLRRILDALATRYGPRGEVGRVRGWIVGNEVNSHHWWYNLGRAPLDEVVAAYEPAVRLVHEVVSQRDPPARVYVSLEHHWGTRFAAGDERAACGGRALLEAFADRARRGGDFPWHVAFHPYPEDLFDCRFWEDESAVDDDASPRITFKNLHVLTRFLERDELRFGGRPRRVILSEQGFHCRAGERGAADQAAAFALAWRTVQELDGIDAFIYHRHVDHAHEGGLRLGLWTRVPGSVATPHERRPIWRLFRDCDGPGGEEAVRAALPAGFR